MTSSLSSSAAPSRWADDTTLRLVRPEVRALLEASPSFDRLSDEEKRTLAGTMVKVAAYMANPDGVVDAKTGTPGAQAGIARAQADEDPVQATKRRLSQDPGFAGEDFEGGAIKQGTKQFGELVKKVNFPKFVSGLIQGVFQAIVDSSIQQMRAYGELLANVAKTVDQFAQDNITENNSRDWLSQRFPDKLGIGTSEMDSGFAEGDVAPPPQPKLVVKAEDEAAALTAISADLGLEKPITTLDDPNEELRLVLAARLQIAKSRQQLLASMVMLGINRIVVTDGLIHAKVIFDMKASDQAKRVAKASMYDNVEDKTEVEGEISYGGWFSPISASLKTTTSSDHVTTVESSVDDTSESKAEVKAKLSGEVRVNFKSDYMPMEKLATPQMIAAIQGNAKPADKPEKPTDKAAGKGP